MSGCAWWTHRIPHSGEFLQSEAGTKESACHLLCGSKDGPTISGTVQITTDRSEVAQVYLQLAVAVAELHTKWGSEMEGECAIYL